MLIERLISTGVLAIGLVILIYGADALVRGASSIAKRAGLSSLFIGLTIVSFGTSLPELVVNLFASFQGSNDIAIGNILGSNISNTLLILGVAASIYPLSVKRGTVTKEIPFSLLAVVALYIMVNDIIFDQGVAAVLSRADGLILLLFFAIFMYYTFGLSKGDMKKDVPSDVKIYPYTLSLSLVVGGIIGLVVGGNFAVDGGVGLAVSFGLSEAFIGLTVIAIGTSLPELAASAVAAYRKQADIAIGNVVGSNIFNILWILGLSAVIKPLSFSLDLNFDVIIIVMITSALMLMMFIGKRNILERWQGATLVSMYVMYIIYLIIRG